MPCCYLQILCYGYLHSSAKSTLAFDLAEAKNRPVSKVITLLKDTLKQLVKEVEEVEEIYDQLASESFSATHTFSVHC